VSGLKFGYRRLVPGCLVAYCNVLVERREESLAPLGQDKGTTSDCCSEWGGCSRLCNLPNETYNFGRDRLRAAGQGKCPNVPVSVQVRHAETSLLVLFSLRARRTRAMQGGGNR
jgi:hypothetical protein